MTGKNVATVSKRSQYPIVPDPASDALVDALVGFKNADGSYDLRRAMTPDERRRIEARRNVVADNLASCRAGEIVGDILEMLMGFGGGDFQTEETASAVAAQYAAVLSTSPVWAVKRACGRWARGEVTAEEIGEKSISRSRAPSAAQVRVVAEKIANPFRQELTRLNRTLKAGTVPTPPTEEERRAAAPKIKEMLAEIDSRFAKSELAETQARAAAQAKTDRKNRKWAEQRMRAEWVALGVAPPRPLFSVALARSLGYEILNGVLLRPKPPEPKPDRDMNT